MWKPVRGMGRMPMSCWIVTHGQDAHATRVIVRNTVRLVARGEVKSFPGMKTRERIYIIPQWSGMVFAGVVFAIFVFGYFANGFAGLPQTLVISFVVVGIVALIQTNENLRGIEVVSCHSQPVPAGEDAVLEVLLRNASDRERLALKVRVRTGWRLVGDARVEVLRPGAGETVRIRIPTTRRGCYPQPPLWVSSDLPFGLCFAWKVFADRGGYVVYPRPVGQPLAAPAAADGEDGSRAKKGVEDISGHRPYFAGDLLSRLDWRIFARSGKLAVKTFEGNEGLRIRLAWEDTVSLPGTEARLEQLSFWVSECVRNRRAFELHLGSASRHLNESNPAACRIALAAFSQS